MTLDIIGQLMLRAGAEKLKPNCCPSSEPTFFLTRLWDIPHYNPARESERRKRMRPIVTISVIVLGVGIGAPESRAHHSFAPHFDSSKPVNISGTIKSYEARNPHSYLHIDAVDENGRTREYVC